jgi:hypothetical protein
MGFFCPSTQRHLNLACLHPVACVRSGDESFYPCTQRHLNLGCLHPVACVRSGDGSFLSVYATSP